MSRFVRAPLRSLAGGLALAILGSIAALADAGGIVVSLDRARIVKVPAGTQTLIIGNPLVADVTMLKGNGSMVVSGRSFGTTNLISLDSSGNAIDETTIKVVPGNQSLVVLRGTAQESYSCNPRCSPTIALGDDTKFMADGVGNVKTRTGAALTGGK
ncbi:MAG TPA: pilus assembly protein N-terminal domain-containing protein [Rhodoblastus sp.]|nr:pilus assembly protein N-terminal domain-containing protein [Rhodoblastus sp.]